MRGARITRSDAVVSHTVLPEARQDTNLFSLAPEPRCTVRGMNLLRRRLPTRTEVVLTDPESGGDDGWQNVHTFSSLDLPPVLRFVQLRRVHPDLADRKLTCHLLNISVVEE